MCFSCPVQTPQCLDAACTHVGTRAPGPVGVVLERLNAVGTVWDPSCTAFRDCFGIWSPWTSCFSEVKARLVCAWQVAIAAPLQHRAGFAGFASVDPASTRRAAEQYTGEARAFLRVAWNGTFYTQAELFHLGQGETNACHFCGQPDSIKHRLLTCPYFNQERQRHATLISKAPELPDCQFLHCWAVRGPEAFSVPSFLVGLPSLVLDFQFVPEQGSTLDLFTDGSCLEPTSPELRLAAWAVTIATHSTALPPIILSAGPLSGFVQTAFRAELTAVLSAISFSVRFQVPVRIWSDCAGVVRRVRELVQGSPVPPRCPNRDLWLPLAAELQSVPEGFCITHVPSHEDPACHDDPVAQWAVSNNNLVDSVASSVNLDRSPSFWRTWTKLRDHLADQHRLMFRRSCSFISRWLTELLRRNLQERSTSDTFPSRVFLHCSSRARMGVPSGCG